MINFQVQNLKFILIELKREGVAVELRTEESEFGNFG